MPTIITHAAIPLALGLGLGSRVIPGRLLLAGVAASILPDFDVLAFHVGIPYEHALGHRGFSHALLTAVVVGAVASVAARWLGAARALVFAFIAVSMASHGLLDMLTDGGKGVGLFWPFSDTRHFFPWHPIEVSPIGIRRIFSARGIEVAVSELRWIWLPATAACLLFYFGVRPRIKNNF